MVVYKTSISNVLDLQKSIPSKRVNLEVSSKSHPNHIAITNAWVVQDLTITSNHINIDQFSKDYPYLSDIPIANNVKSDVSILIGAD